MKEHYETYLGYAEKLGVSFIQHPEIQERIYDVQSGDTHFNNSRLAVWDAYHTSYAYRARELKLDPRGWSLANSVCTAKVAALRDALIHITGEDINTAEELLAAVGQLETPEIINTEHGYHLLQVNDEPLHDIMLHYCNDFQATDALIALRDELKDDGITAALIGTDETFVKFSSPGFLVGGIWYKVVRE